MHMRDSELVVSIVAGDPGGLAAAYDRYADPLYKYCRSVLSNPADAADAVQNTFVIAASRLAELRDPDRLRAWLYAVARDECLQILRSPRPAPRVTVPPGMADTIIDITEGAAERAELRALLTTAARGLNPAEREVLELQLRQGLEPAEVADVLGLSHSRAHSLASRARDQLEACLAVLLVGRAGRDDCRELNTLLADWDGQLTPALRRRAGPAHRALPDLHHPARLRAAPGRAARPVGRGGDGRRRGGEPAARGRRARGPQGAHHGARRRPGSRRGRAPRRRGQPGRDVRAAWLP